ncbi:MAG: sulfite exporter TauE/SafE family protein [Leptospiraceae bacterium]|nr:sulfite exporter TauE/SafE family protein [Leptospiraceae bacterium]MCP5496451.1 sulfite exporter TauE/SafE family protein [Leptospiraceae bacterium]
MIFSTAFLEGFLGSLHCLGMCGPIVYILNQKEESKLMTNVIYNVSRSISYAIIGFLLGTFGLGLDMFFLKSIALYIGSFLIILMAIYYMFPGLFEMVQIKFPISPYTKITKVVHSFKENGKIYAALLGFVSGLLPCGLLYPAYILSFMSGTPFLGSITMIIFSLGTYPMMFGIGYSSIKILAKMNQKHLKFITGIIMLCVGLGLIYYRSQIEVNKSPICH